MTGPLIVGPSPEGASMDKLRCLANGARRHISRGDARHICDLFEEMCAKVSSLTLQLDHQYGTPCAQIRWQQEREELLEALEALKHCAWNVYQAAECGDFEFEQAVAAANAAIAKARGAPSSTPISAPRFGGGGL